MSRDYNLSALNDKEFEILCADLIAKEEQVKVERFKPGKDSGIDGRYFSISGDECIIQCKHWEKSGYKALLAKIKTNELAKIQKLKPKKYKLMTSVPLSPAYKEELVKALTPWITTQADIYGKEDIEDLLIRHESVVRNTYKLWITSTAVLKTILDAAILGRSEAHFQEVINSSEKYVATTFHNKALKKLEAIHSIIINGEAGIGKTTLADQLSLNYVADGFEFICIENSINEAESAWDRNTRQIFYFDDFLGRNYLDAISGRDDTHIVRFIKRVSKDKKKRFILTSRTTILNRGKLLSDIFEIENVNKNEFEIRIGKITQLEKAQILYNHIWFGELDAELIEEIYKDSRYLEIINHRNYNPRIISFITDKHKIQNDGTENYWEFISQSLENPQMVWRHVYESQLDNISQWILCILVANGSPIEEGDLQSFYLQYKSEHGSTDKHNDLLNFNKSLRVAVGAVVNRHLSEDTAKIDLFTPSIGDYILQMFKGGGLSCLQYFKALDTTSSVINLGTLIKEAIISSKISDTIFIQLLSHAISQKKGTPYLINLCKTIGTTKPKNKELKINSAKYLSSNFQNFHDECEPELYIEAIHESIEAGILDESNQLIGYLINEFLESESEDIATLETIANLLYYRDLNSELKGTYTNEVRRQIVAFWEENPQEFLHNTDILGSHHSLDDLEEMKDELALSFSSYMSDYFDEPVTAIETKTVFESINLEDEAIDYWSGADWDGEGGSHRSMPEASSITDIHDLFDRS